MIFLEFTHREDNTQKMHFIGVSRKAIMDDTKNGTEFANCPFSACREMTKEEVFALKLEFTDEGILAIVREHSQSFKLGLPK